MSYDTDAYNAYVQQAYRQSQMQNAYMSQKMAALQMAVGGRLPLGLRDEFTDQRILLLEDAQ